VTLASTNADVTVPATLSFSTANFNTYQNASVGGLADPDQANDTATITLGNVDAPSNTTIGVTVTDNTIVENWGWPNPFTPNTASHNTTVGFAYQITVTQNTNLDAFGVYSPSSTTAMKMALYTNAGGQPGNFIAEASGTLTTGTAIFDATNITLSAGTYWIAFRVNASATLVGTSLNVRNRCIKSISTFSAAWPPSWGSTSCDDDAEVNIWIRTFR
jgi:hypothetical protein